MKTLGALVSLLLLGATLAHATPKEMPPGDVARWLGFFDKLVVTVTRNQTCERMAADVSSLVDQNKPVIAIARKARATGQKLPEAAQQHMLEGVTKMVPAMRKCGQHDKVRAAFAKLDLDRR